MNKRIVALLLSLVAVSCSTGGSRPESEGPAPAAKPAALTREMAATRSKQVQHVSYILWFGLDAERAEFDGRAVISFELRPGAPNQDVLVDFEEGSVRNLTLNGKPVDDLGDVSRYDGHWLRFRRSELLATGSNRLEVGFAHPYSTTGNGLHRFKDPADGRVYLYSNFEPYNAHRLFPCFDQPDIKATYELTVEAPPEWLVIANTRETEITNVSGRKSWAFPPSPVFSTYVFALHAGPYAAWKSHHEEIPLRLFARRSLAKHVDHAEWLDVTRRGLDFFNVQFGYPYPYGKYDQVIVPDFNAGAMENVAAVTFSERYVPRTRITQDQRRRRADTILHEMAHMWFGNLVTMRWWNGLWLNESFATFAANWAVDQATQFQGTWQGFFARTKSWGYWEDQLVTTHPIEVSIGDTDQAFANFDGITYAKGASTLKQLSFLLGEDSFREGLQRYFQRYAHRNTTLADFIGMMSQASERDLAGWQRLWLQTAGLNTVEAQWECGPDEKTGKSVLTKLELHQTGSDASQPERRAELRPHKTIVALYRRPRGSPQGPLTPGKPLEVEYSQAVTPVEEAIGEACPDLVYPNHTDQDYVKVQLDAASLRAARKSLSRIGDPFARQMLWHSLWEMVVDGKLKAQEFADIALANLALEKDTQIISKVMGNLSSEGSSSNTVVRILDGELRTKYRARIEALARSRAQASPAGSDLQLVWYQGFLRSAFSRTSQKLVQAWLEGTARIPGMEIDQERRWELLQVLSRTAAKDALERIQAELAKDTTDMGQKEAVAAEAAHPDSELKKQWFARMTKEAPATEWRGVALKNAHLREAIDAFHPMAQEDRAREYVDAYFEALPRLAASKEDEEYLGEFAEGMFPSLCTREIAEKAGAFLAANPGLPAAVTKSVRVARQEEERCVRARELSTQAKDAVLGAAITQSH